MSGLHRRTAKAAPPTILSRTMENAWRDEGSSCDGAKATHPCPMRPPPRHAKILDLNIGASLAYSHSQGTKAGVNPPSQYCKIS